VDLPCPFHLTPAIHVLLNNEQLCDFRATNLWEGQIGPPYNVLDRMKAINNLLESGLSEKTIQVLEDLISGVQV
jgi:hypothetical protein